MAVLKVEFDNFLCFDNFSADFSYPKKLVDSNLDGEYLAEFPNIRFRKVNIIVGSNASGKTSLGRAIWHTFMFLNEKEGKALTSLIKDPNKETSILMDYIYKNGFFFRVEIKIEPNAKEIWVRLRRVDAQKNDSYESLIKRLDNSVDFENYISALDKFEFSGWNFSFPSIESGFDIIKCDHDESDKKEFCQIYESVLKTMDSSIKRAYPSKEVENSYIIDFYDGQSVAVTNGEKLSEIRKLSSGTKYAINIADVIFSIKKHYNGFYFVDEQFSYVNSDIEIACLMKMISLLDDGEQLFFTTHNEELLALPLPNHAFNFISKVNNQDGLRIAWVNASIEKRNNVNIKNLYDNDYFNASPDVNGILNIAES